MEGDAFPRNAQIQEFFGVLLPYASYVCPGGYRILHFLGKGLIMSASQSCPTSQSWKSLFTDWPVDLPRRGVILSTLNEIMPFTNFWLRDEMVMLERKNPDTSGSRYILMNYEGIDSVRFIDPLSDQVIASAGFSTGVVERKQQPASRTQVARPTSAN